jgi:hypothetical protein
VSNIPTIVIDVVVGIALNNMSVAGEVMNLFGVP